MGFLIRLSMFFSVGGFLLMSITGGFSGCGPTSVSCQDVGDCLGGQQCTANKCVDVEPTTTHDAAPADKGGQETGPPDALTEPVGEQPVEKIAETHLEKPSEAPPKESSPADKNTGCQKDSDCTDGRYCRVSTGTCHARLCAPCQNNCGKDELCLKTSTGETFCGSDCSKGQKCPTGFNCFNIGTTGAKQCAPVSLSCTTKPGMGAACKKDGGLPCPFHAPLCVTKPGQGDGMCSKACQSAADCPVGFKRCLDDGAGTKTCAAGCQDAADCPLEKPRCVGSPDKTCQEKPYTGPEACGRGSGNAMGVGKPCPNGVSDCSGVGGLCLGKLASPLSPFCTKTCQTDADCGVEASCQTIEDNGVRKSACLPLDCLCLAAPALAGKKDLLGQALKEIGRDRCSLIYEKREFGLISPQVAFDPFRLPFFDRLHREPLRLLDFGKASARQLDGALQKQGLETVPEAIALGAGWLGAPVTRKTPSVQISANEPLAAAIIALHKAHKGTPDEASIKKEAATIPLELQKKLAMIVLAVSAAATARQQALPPEVLQNPAYFFDRAPGMTIPSSRRLDLGPAGKPSRVYWILARDFGYQKMYQAAWDLASVIASVGLKAETSYKGFSLNQKTPLGRIIISDNADHTYSPSDIKYQGDVVLLVDTGGDDIYEIQAGANASANNPVSVLIDLSGKDRYGYVEKPHVMDKGSRFASDDGGRNNAPNFCEKDADCGIFGRACIQAACQRACLKDADCGGANKCTDKGGKKYCSNLVQSGGPISLSDRARQGAGRLGIAFLFDLGKESDEYRSLRMSQGFGVLGVGVLYDEGGDERYQCEAGCQGSGIFGLGLLIDRGGSDLYHTYTFGQGFGYVKGAGILLDQQGDDQYMADHGNQNEPFLKGKGDPMYLSAQLPGQANSSFVQGAGFGRRADTSDFHFMSGGIGILRDKAGKDRYVCGVFGQGAGYWYGTGLLLDEGGDDLYDGFWYVQSATAHFGLSVLLEGGGNDKYNSILTPRATHTGVGHDFSTSWLVDEGGNDVYNAAGLALGSGNDNGYGFLIDNGGDDQYTCKNNTLGIAQSPNPDDNGRNTRKVRTLGIFIDAGGADKYTRPDGTAVVGNDKLWKQGRSKDGTARRGLEDGVGVDGTGDTTLHTK